MQYVSLTAVCVGGATIIGALAGFFINAIPERIMRHLMIGITGILFFVAVGGLVVPAFTKAGVTRWWLPAAGFAIGISFLRAVDLLLCRIYMITGVGDASCEYGQLLQPADNPEYKKRVLLLVLAIAIHNLPEGMAAGVSFATEDVRQTVAIIAGIVLQNFPEGFMVVPPMFLAGFCKKKVLLIAAFTGILEMIGTFIGYLATTVSNQTFPFILAFAGGTMLYAVGDTLRNEIAEKQGS